MTLHISEFIEEEVEPVDNLPATRGDKKPGQTPEKPKQKEQPKEQPKEKPKSTPAKSNKDGEDS
jgi:hypothetical protein